MQVRVGGIKYTAQFTDAISADWKRITHNTKVAQCVEVRGYQKMPTAAAMCTSTKNAPFVHHILWGLTVCGGEEGIVVVQKPAGSSWYVDSHETEFKYCGNEVV